MTTTTPRAETPAAPVVTSTWGLFAFLPHVLFGVVCVLTYLMAPATGLAVLSVTSCLFAITLALSRGGAYLTPSSVFLIASGVFIGGAAYYLGRLDLSVEMFDLRNAALLALLTTIGISFVATVLSVQWRLHWPAPQLDGDRPSFTPPYQFTIRALALIGLSQVPFVESIAGPIATAAGLCGVLMVSLTASSRRVRMRWQGDLLGVALVVIVPLLWVQLDFTGGGRLRVAGLGIAAFVGWNLVRPYRYQKVLVILCIPLFLIFAGLNRLDQRETNKVSTSGSSVLEDGKGLGSVYSPLETWAQIIEPKTPEQEARLGPRHGATFFNALVLPVPRGLWLDKPKGFGNELVGALEVEGVSENHSIAGLIQGEWYANFGYPGLGLLVVVMGGALALLDRAHSRLVRSGLRRPVDWWRTVALMCCLSSIADLFWVGTFTWFARGGLAAAAALIVGRFSLHRLDRYALAHAEAGPAVPPPVTSR